MGPKKKTSVVLLVFNPLYIHDTSFSLITYCLLSLERLRETVSCFICETTYNQKLKLLGIKFHDNFPYGSDIGPADGVVDFSAFLH
jgi:hypothetical protein